MQGMNFSCSFCGEADLPKASNIEQYDLCESCNTVLTANSLNPYEVIYDKRQTTYYTRIPVIKPGPGAQSSLIKYIPLSISQSPDNVILTRPDFVKFYNSKTVKDKEVTSTLLEKPAYQLNDLTELKDIVNHLKPFERAWCKELQSDIIMYPTGYAVLLWDCETDRAISSYFVPKGH